MSWQPGNTLEEVERETIIAALRYHQGNRTHAAASLGVSLRTIANKITKYMEQGHQVPGSERFIDAEVASA